MEKRRGCGQGVAPCVPGSVPRPPKKSRAVRARCVLQALEGALAAADYEALFADDDRKASLGELLVRAGTSEEDSRLRIAEAEVRLQATSQAQVAMRADVARLLGRDETGLKLRVDGGWLFSRYDAIALMLEPEQQDQARKIWERMQEAQSLSGVSTRHAAQTFKFPGQGRETPVAAVRGIVEMLFLVPGKRAAAFRRSVADVFVRFVGGDPLLLEEVEEAARVQNFL